jgi:hypothetical protein
MEDKLFIEIYETMERVKKLSHRNWSEIDDNDIQLKIKELKERSSNRSHKKECLEKISYLLICPAVLAAFNKRVESLVKTKND